MANWGRNLSNAHQIFAEAIFNSKFIECEAEFCWFPRYDEWQGSFKTKFQYLHLNECISLKFNFLDTYDNFVDEIKNIRNKIKNEYDLYFNDLWC